MAVDRWNEEGKFWLEDHGLLEKEQVAQCARADEAEPFRSPVPTRMISNGEYMPIPQTAQQQRVEARVRELTESASKKLGVTRRQFLASSGGMAAALIAMNEVFGRMFDVDPLEMFEPAAYAQAGPPRDLFVFDDQLHFVRGASPGPTFLRAAATGPSAARTDSREPTESRREARRVGQHVERVESGARGVAGRPPLCPPDELHQRGVSRQPGHGRPPE